MNKIKINKSFHSSMIPKSVRKLNNGVTTHECKTTNCNRIINIKTDYCFCCEAKRLKRVYGIG
jgi:hypothetical protein